MTKRRPGLHITAELGAHAIALNPGRNPDGTKRKRFITLCPIRYRFGDKPDDEEEVPGGYEFDGPTEPRVCWVIDGLSPADVDTAFASCKHDWDTEHPNDTPRDIADARFRVALGPHTINGQYEPGVGWLRRWAMYVAVRYWSHKSGATE